MKILIIHGPNLQLLGLREPGIYGSESLAGLNIRLAAAAKALGVEIITFQSNHEGAIIDRIAEAYDGKIDGIVINPAAYTHTSIGIADALKAVSIPAIEVHISNIHARDSFRAHSMTASACLGVIAGLGIDSYEWALQALVRHLRQQQ